MTLNSSQLQGIQVQAIYQRIAGKLKEESSKNLPSLIKKTENLKKAFFASKDTFVQAKKAWFNSSEFLDYKAMKNKINHKSIVEKTLSIIKPLKKHFDDVRKNKIRLLNCKIYELEENPNSLAAKFQQAVKNKKAALEAYKKARSEKNRAFAESIIGERLEKLKNLSAVKSNITKNISNFTTEKTTKETKLVSVETGLKASNWALDINKAKKIVDKGRRTFLQFIKKIPKETALEENKKLLLEAENRYKLAPANKVIDSLKKEISSLAKKIKNENILKKYSNGIFKDIKTQANYEFAQEAGKNIQIR